MKQYSIGRISCAIACVVAFVTLAIDANEVQEDIVYVERDGIAVSYDVVPSPNPNGAAVLLMSSGGWFSGKQPIDRVKQGFGFLLDAGYTVVPIRHRSAPDYKVPDAVADVQHAVRHVRHHADDYGIDPSRMAVMGFSSGGHLTLMISLDSDDGVVAESSDSVSNTANHVAAGIAYFPPVDLENIVGPSERFPALDFDPSLASSVSPINFADSEDPPILLLHGTADELVPLANSTRMHETLTGAGAKSQLSVFEGAGHGFREPADQERARSEILEFLASHLASN
ncbi:MAG: alpha/beta hydrolase [Gammaproteobacteria bacterium]|nr:alpha/beta hydrolase [Gammaproteobacteria bacterium]